MHFTIVKEEFTSPHNRAVHYKKHVLQNNEFDMSEEEYEKESEALAKTPVNHKTILGYISETREGKHAYCKYNKLTGLFTVYTYIDGEPKTITAYRKNWQEFTGDMGIEYFDEIPTEL